MANDINEYEYTVYKHTSPDGLIYIGITKQQPAKQTVRPYSQKNDNDYLLKYNIDDLEAAPWLNGGKRKI